MNPLLSDAEQGVRDEARALALKKLAPIAAQIDAAGQIPSDVLQALAAAVCAHAADDDKALFGLALRIEQFARSSAAAGAAAMSHGLAAWALSRHTGVPDPMLDGSRLVAFGGADHGVNATTSDDGVRLSGRIDSVPGATYADAFVVVVADGDTPGVYGVGGDTSGVTVAPRQLLGLRGSGTGELRLDDVVAEPLALGAEAVDAMAQARRVVQSAKAVGIATASLDAALAHVSEDRERGGRLGRTQSVQWMLADIATETEAARVATWNAALDTAGTRPAIARLLAAETAVNASRRAMQIIGAAGALHGTEIERLYRDAKLMEILGGSNEDQLRAIADELLPEITQG